MKCAAHSSIPVSATPGVEAASPVVSRANAATGDASKP